MRKLLVILIMMLTACASQNIADKPEIKKELALWQVLQYKVPGEKSLIHEDKWYRYDVEFDYVVKGAFDNTNMMQGACPIAKADYTVTEKDTKAVIRNMALYQLPCEPCHRR
ncbi:MAG: hypothetical protein HY954_07860 [Deltaproteobacteria bacterium]|nr:hypothetical protein [Deltaproteobacteria bacterium]